MNKSRIPALTRGLVGSSNRPRNLASKQPTNTTKSSNLLHYGFAMAKTSSSKAGIKKPHPASKEIENKEESEIAKEDALEDARKLDSSEENALGIGKNMSDNSEDKDCGLVDQEDVGLPERHLNLSEAQLNALSYSLSELADKISPSKIDYFDDEEWKTKQKSETERRNSIGRGKIPGEAGTAPHSKSPYSRKKQAEKKTYLSKQKSFNNNKTLSTSRELNLSDDDKARSSDMQPNMMKLFENREMMFKAASPSHQESVESGYNSSWSTSSLKSDFKHFQSSTDTDIDLDSTDVGEQQNDTSAAEYEKVLQQKLSDVEKRINSLILGADSVYSDEASRVENKSDKKSNECLESEEKNVHKKSTGILRDELKEGILANGFGEDLNEPPSIDLTQNKSKSLARSRDVDQEISGKSSFDLHKIRKTSLDESRVSPQPKRPGLVRRRTTLVTFRAPRQASAFNEVDDSGVLEIDEAGFVQCLTDVRAMKTMLLKLKRELQEAEVVSPLAKSKSISSRSISNLSNLCEDDSEETVVRRNTYDSSQGIHEKLRRIRSASLSRRKQSSCLERPGEEQHAAETSTEATVETIQTTDEETKKMKEEVDDLREKLKSLKQERDTLVVDKEEVERELETKNHTIKLLQKQLEVQEKSEELAYLKRQVAALTYQVRQQQQKITELKYRSSTPPNTSRSTSPTNFSAKKDSVKHDIKNRLRDAFVRHLEESSKTASYRKSLDLHRTYSEPLERPKKPEDTLGQPTQSTGL